MDYRDAATRYRNDPSFRAAVDAMVQWQFDLKLSAGEMRAAALFAEIKFLQDHRPPPMISASQDGTIGLAPAPVKKGS